MREKNLCDINFHIKRIRSDAIHFDPIDPDAKYIGTCYPHADGHTVFEINPRRCTDEFEQALTLLHECLHDDPRFNEREVCKRNNITGMTSDVENQKKIYSLIEKEIDDEALKILAKYPKVLNCIVTKLRQAKAMEIGKWQERAGGNRLFWFRFYTTQAKKKDICNLILPNKPSGHLFLIKNRKPQIYFFS